MKYALVVPAYKPTAEMIPMLARFSDDADCVPVVIDDGSGPQSASLFERLPENCVLIRHDANRGKGAALKTGFGYVLEKLPECALAVTADADGQHLFDDIQRVRRTAEAHRDCLVMGSRRFDEEVPLRSRIGNAITNWGFRVMTHRRMLDTQSGLRGIWRNHLPLLLKVPGERYEYEINMLLQCAHQGIELVEEPISAVYINQNAASHFKPIRDSLKIYGSMLRFALRRNKDL